jgi:hypothetical protein
VVVAVFLRGSIGAGVHPQFDRLLRSGRTRSKRGFQKGALTVFPTC